VRIDRARPSGLREEAATCGANRLPSTAAETRRGAPPHPEEWQLPPCLWAKLATADVERKAAGLVDLRNPDFDDVAMAMGLWGRTVSKVGEFEDTLSDLARGAWLPLLHVKVKPLQLVMPPSPLLSSPAPVVGMAVYGARPRCTLRGEDAWDMMPETIARCSGGAAGGGNIIAVLSIVARSASPLSLMSFRAAPKSLVRPRT